MSSGSSSIFYAATQTNETRATRNKGGVGGLWHFKGKSYGWFLIEARPVPTPTHIYNPPPPHPNPCWEAAEASLTLKQAFEGCDVRDTNYPTNTLEETLCADAQTQTHTTHSAGSGDDNSDSCGGSSTVYALIENPDPLFFFVFSFFLFMISSFRACLPPAPLHAPSLLSYNSSISWLVNSDSSNEEKGKMKGEEGEGTLNERKRGRYQRRV